MLMKKIIQKNENAAKIGMRIITFMMLFVVANNIIVISANALAFNPFNSGTVAGTVNTGNGYFDDDASFFNYSGDRNIYLVSELNGSYLFEPISRASAISGDLKVLNSSLNTIYDSVVHKGYIYFIDGTTLKKKQTRNDGSMCESTDTGIGGCIQNIASGVMPPLRSYNDVLYFQTGAYPGYKTLNHLDENDNQISDFTPTQASSGLNSFAVVTSAGTLYYYTTLIGPSSVSTMYKCSSASCVGLASPGGVLPVYSTYFTLSSYVYGYTKPTSSGSITQKIFVISNNSGIDVSYLSTNINTNNRAYVGSKSTIGLGTTSSTYYTFNSIEVGTDSLPTVPAELTYTSKTISSLQSSYYNRSNIIILYNVVLNLLNANNILLDFGDYRWMVSMTDPNGVSKDVYLTSSCQYTSILDTTCEASETLEFAWPAPGWMNGTWSSRLYEINTVTSNRALIATSSSFTVLNTTVENQSIINPPVVPPTSGTAPQAITRIDGFVSWLGLGVNSVSKLLFAMIIIAIAATVGLGWGNGNIAMVFAFVPFAFFTFIDYIPKWIFIIAIILITIVSRAFR